MLEKISLQKHWDPLKKHESKVKTTMGISTRNSDKKNLRKQMKVVKQKKNAEINRQHRKNLRYNLRKYTRKYLQKKEG